MKPNHATFVGVMSTCSHVGPLDEGCFYFYSMTREYGFVPLMLEDYS
jgi:pentatricopeptide repeat protein